MKTLFVSLLILALIALGESSYSVTAPESWDVDVSFKVTWTAPSGHSKYDYLTLYSGDYTGDYLYNLNTLSTTYLYSSATSGSVSFSFSDPTKYYIVAYYQYNNSTASAVSDVILSSTAGYAVSVYRANVYTPFNVDWSASASIGSDLTLVLYLVNADGTWSEQSEASLVAGQTSGSSVFEANAPGNYLAVLYAYYQSYVLASYPFTVGTEGFEVDAPSKASIFESFEVTWTAPASHSSYDEIVLWLRNNDGSVSQGTVMNVNGNQQGSGVVELEVTAPGTYYATYELSSGQVVAVSDDFVVEVAGFELAVPTSVSVETTFSVIWYAPADHYEYDYIYLYSLNWDNTLSYVSYANVFGSGETSGSVNFTVDHVGTYVAKYLSAYYYNQQYAESVFFNATVDLYSIALDDEAYVGQNFTINWKAPYTHSGSDQIVVYYYNSDGSVTVADSQYIPMYQDSGVITFVLFTPGVYRVDYVMYSSYLPYPYTEAVESEIIFVYADGYYVDVPASVNLNQVFYVNWTAPYAHNNGDQISIALYQADLNAYSTVDTEYTQSVATTGVVSFSVYTAGEYVAFYGISPSATFIAVSDVFYATPN